MKELPMVGAFVPPPNYNTGRNANVIEAVGILAEIVAINFLEWADIKAVRNGQSSWTVGAGKETKHYTTKQLYDLYLEKPQS